MPEKMPCANSIVYAVQYNFHNPSEVMFFTPLWMVNLRSLPMFLHLVSKVGMAEQGFHSALSETKGDQLTCC
jgi:hypothetical protein